MQSVLAPKIQANQSKHTFAPSASVRSAPVNSLEANLQMKPDDKNRSRHTREYVIRVSCECV